jgi:hypothetical protein
MRIFLLAVEQREINRHALLLYICQKLILQSSLM